MATVTVFTAARMKQIEDETITDASLSGDHLVLMTRNGQDIDVGSVKGDKGDKGEEGLQFWTSATAINSVIGASTGGVVPRLVSGRTVKIGDTILSENSSSLGVYGTITAVSSQTSVTVRTLGSLRGPSGITGDIATVGTAYGSITGSRLISGKPINGGFSANSNGTYRSWVRFFITPSGTGPSYCTWAYERPLLYVPVVNATPGSSSSAVRNGSVNSEDSVDANGTYSTVEVGVYRENTTETRVLATVDGFWKAPGI